MQQQIWIKDNFINNKLCAELIKFFETYYNDLGAQFSDRKLLNFSHIIDQLSNDNPKQDIDHIKYLQTKLDQNIGVIDPSAFINYSHIVRRDKDSFQLSHTDFDYHSWTSILYLNEDFIGGETCIENEIISPQSGTLITFKGNCLEHQVLPVTSGRRYNILVWYKTI